METMGQRIAILRGNFGLSVRDLEDCSGVSKASISRLERDEYDKPTLDVLRGLAFGLDCSVGYLIGERPTPTTKED